MATYFSQILVILTLITGVIWVIDRFYWRPKRQQALAAALAKTENLATSEQQKLIKRPSWVENSGGVFPILAAVLILRSFLYEPFQIPSGSMMPTLLVGDFILVEKFSYGIREPMFRNKFIETGKPQRGDIAVFKYPEQPTVDYIKRIVGLPGDTIRYRNKQLFIKPACKQGQTCPNFQVIPLTERQQSQFNMGPYPLWQANEQLPELSHQILINLALPDMVNNYYNQTGSDTAEWVVPANQYFALGDNRDNSRDSRFWGFVPEQNLVGKAVCIWISFEFENDADSWLPSWVPTGVRFNRIGGLR